MTVEKRQFDLVVLGAGPGGYVAAIRAAQLGMKVAVVEKEELGGICLNWGCIPTKSLLRNAEIYRMVKNSREFGITVADVSVDFSRVIKRSRQVSERLVKGIHFLFKKNKIETIKGFGRLSSAREVEILDADGKVTEVVEGNNIIVATGARPKEIPGIPIDRKKVITAREAMILPEIPESMIIIGAGAIGVEFAYFYNSFGTKVTLVEMLPHILPVEDEEIAAVLQRSFKKAKIKILTETRVTGVE